MVAKEEWVKELQGLSLKNVRASAYRLDGSRINQEFGEMLFTHFGVSGPIILSMSRDIGEVLHSRQETVRLCIDLKPALTEEKLDKRLQRDLDIYSRRQFKTRWTALPKIDPSYSSIERYRRKQGKQPGNSGGAQKIAATVKEFGNNYHSYPSY